MKVKLGKKTLAKVFAVLGAILLMSVSQVYGYQSFSLSSSDYGVLTYWYFNETGYTTDSQNQCGSPPLPVSQCFSFQLNTDTSVGTTANFYQAVLSVYPGSIAWTDWIGCPPPGQGSCAYQGGHSITGGRSLLNGTTNDIFVMAIDPNQYGVAWGITSCSYSFTQPAYSFEFFILNLSTCTASNSFTDSLPSSYFPSSTFSYIQSVPVGLAGGSSATFKHTQVTGELFNRLLGTYTGSSNTLTAESSNIVLKDGTLGHVVPLCYYSPDVSAPC